MSAHYHLLEAHTHLVMLHFVADSPELALEHAGRIASASGLSYRLVPLGTVGPYAMVEPKQPLPQGVRPA